MECETEEPLFTFGCNPRSNVEKDCRRRFSGREHSDDAALLDDEETLRSITSVADEHRA
jgi:hypothetical protein